jgi:pimeloyl-ACP methyl ester carboxylesterase
VLTTRAVDTATTLQAPHPPARRIGELVDLLRPGWTVAVIPTPRAGDWIDNDKLEEQTGFIPVRMEYKRPDDALSCVFPGHASALGPPDLHWLLQRFRRREQRLEQNEQRKNTRLAMPVLAIGGEASAGAQVGEAMKHIADDVQSAVIPGAGHFVAEEAPEDLLAALTAR